MKKDPALDTKFKVGDRVVVNKNGWLKQEIGLIGTVSRYEPIFEHSYFVTFGDEQVGTYYAENQLSVLTSQRLIHAKRSSTRHKV